MSSRWVTQMKQVLLQKAGRESDAKGFYEYEGSGLGSGNDREKAKETTTSIYTKQCNIQFDHRTTMGWVKGIWRRLGQNQKDL